MFDLSKSENDTRVEDITGIYDNNFCSILPLIKEIVVVC